jgi:hypothetical protein
VNASFTGAWEAGGRSGSGWGKTSLKRLGRRRFSLRGRRSAREIPPSSASTEMEVS